MGDNFENNAFKVASHISESFKVSQSYLATLKTISENAKTSNIPKSITASLNQASSVTANFKSSASYAEVLMAYTNSLPKSTELQSNFSSRALSDWIKRFEEIVDNAKINNLQFSNLVTSSITLRSGLTASYNLDTEYSLDSEESIIEDKILEKANDVLDIISANSQNALSAINNFLIELFKVDSVSFTRSFIRDIILNLFCAYLVQTMYPSLPTISNSIVNNNQVTDNNTNSNNQTVVNNNITVNLTIHNLVVGNQYKTVEKKGLKYNRIKKIKNFDNIPEGTTITLIKKYRKYIVISYVEDGVFKYGYTEMDGITEVNNRSK